MCKPLSPLAFVIILVLTISSSYSSFSQVNIKGKIIDAETGEPIQNAGISDVKKSNVVFSDNLGEFLLLVDTISTKELLIEHSSYSNSIVLVNDISILGIIQLSPGRVLSETIITASRVEESIQSSSASITVIDNVDLNQKSSIHPTLALRNVSGAFLTEQGVLTHNVTLRGINSILSTETLVLLDNRRINTGASSVSYMAKSPIHTLDLERIEVIRGPSSAVWGAGGEAGAIHFISKDPFNSPGVSAEFGFGTQSTLQGALRYAGYSKNKRFGYKLLGFYTKIDDWLFDPSDEVESGQIESFVSEFKNIDGSIYELTNSNLIPEAYNWNASAQFIYKLSDDIKLLLEGGMTHLQNNYRQTTTEWFGSNSHPYTKISLDTEKALLQVNWLGERYNRKSFTYRTGFPSLSKVNTFDGQFVYKRLKLNDSPTEFSFGFDYRLLQINTNIMGRFTEEAESGTQTFGGFLKAQIPINDKLNVDLINRIDYFEITEQFAHSPRIGIVYKPNRTQILKLAFNRAIGSPNAFDLWIDLTTGRNLNFNTQIIGGSSGISFPDELNTTAFNGNIYPGIGIDHKDVLQEILPNLHDHYNQDQIDFLLNKSENIVGFSEGFMLLNGSNVSILNNREPIKASSSYTFDIGYRQLFGSKLSIDLDFYYISRKNVTSSPSVINPFVAVANLEGSLLEELETSFSVGELETQNISRDVLFDLISQEAQNISENPIGVVEPIEALDDDNPELILTYSNIDKIDFYGIDLRTKFYLSNDISVVGNYSYISNNVFNQIQKIDLNSETSLTLNRPRHTFNLGLNFYPQYGFNATIYCNYNGSFEAISGPFYSGRNEAYSVVDIGFGYKFKSNLSDLSISGYLSNALNTPYRSFPNTPKIGRIGIIKVTTTI